MPEEGLTLECFGRKLLKDMRIGCLKAIVNTLRPECYTMKLHLPLEMSDSGINKQQYMIFYSMA